MNYSIPLSSHADIKHSNVKINLPIQQGSFWISSPYGIRKNKGKYEMHGGIDLAAVKGTQVKSVLPGIIKTIKIDGGYGKCILIEHENNIQTRYAHLSKILVKEGQYVKEGERIGLVGSTGNTRGKYDPSHLHFELIIEGKKYNPMLHFIH